VGGCNAYEGAGLLYALAVPLALAWSIIGLGLMESRFASTPGKRMFGISVVTETGVRISLRAGVMRRISFLLGPLAWLDWIPFLANRRRRLLDYLAQTNVVEAARGGPS
jgi:uncharacterized RDD family membrane protein YckC